MQGLATAKSLDVQKWSSMLEKQIPKPRSSSCISVYSSNISICTCVETMAIPVSGSVSVEGIGLLWYWHWLGGKVNHLRNQYQHSKTKLSMTKVIAYLY